MNLRILFVSCRMIVLIPNRNYLPFPGWVDSLLSLRRRASSRYLMTGAPNPPANPGFETVVETIPGQAMSSSDANLDDVKRPPQINTSKPPPHNAANASGGSFPAANNPLVHANPGANQVSPFASDTARSRLSSGSVLERSISIVSTIAHFVTDEYPLERLRAQSGGATRTGDEEQGGSPQNNQVNENETGLERGVQGASPLGRGNGLEQRLPHSRVYNETRSRERGSPYAQDGGRSARSQRGGKLFFGSAALICLHSSASAAEKQPVRSTWSTLVPADLSRVVGLLESF